LFPYCCTGVHKKLKTVFVKQRYSVPRYYNRLQESTLFKICLIVIPSSLSFNNALPKRLSSTTKAASSYLPHHSCMSIQSSSCSIHFLNYCVQHIQLPIMVQLSVYLYVIFLVPNG
jgi:hypothetical protein